MLKNIVVLIIAVVFCNHLLYSQSISPLKISTSDIDNFWKAYDQVQKSNDTAQQLNIVQSVYFNNATAGLKDFIAKSEINARSILRCMKKFPKFWTSVRPKTLAVKKHIPEITALMQRYQKLYPQFKQPYICFAMGCFSMGGTTDSSEILIGTEIAAADSSVDASELIPWLQQFFKQNKGINSIIAHEMTHTQQPDGDAENDGKSNLLGYCINEGAADFIAELLLQRPFTRPYITYGKAHEKELWQKFQQEMYGQNVDNWLYNGGSDSVPCGDLGYFEGYAICKSYYEHAENKKQAIFNIINLERKNTDALNRFLEQSQYKTQWQ